MLVQSRWDLYCASRMDDVAGPVIHDLVPRITLLRLQQTSPERDSVQDWGIVKGYARSELEVNSKVIS